MTGWKDRKTFTQVLGHRMAHVEQGQGDVVLFLHGNPTSSYLWRDVMAAMDGAGRLIAPDLIGMGDSDKLPDSGAESYTLAEHGRYLDAWIDQVIGDRPVILVLHDWGGGLGFRWARLNAKRLRGICYMETIVRPMTLDEWPEGIRDLFGAIRSPAGEEMILQKNIFVERILPGSILRALSDQEMTEYRRPFAEPGESRRPTLSWPRQIPLDGEPPEAVQIIGESWAWLSESDVPKLLITAEPGAIQQGAVLDSARSLTNQTEVTVKGLHFIQEDSGKEIGHAIQVWMHSL